MSVRKSVTVLLLTALLLSVLSGCGSKSYASDTANRNYQSPAACETMAASEDFAMSVADAETGSGEESIAEALPENRKWVITMNIDTETEDLDGALDSLNRQIAVLGGYIQEQEAPIPVSVTAVPA